MKNITCNICLLPIQNIDEIHGRISKNENGTIHSYCNAINYGIVPECPLYENLEPKPCSNECVQAKTCETYNTCKCDCENSVCQIGQSVRALRSAGKIPWDGYEIKNKKDIKPNVAIAGSVSIKGIYTNNTRI